MQTYHLIVVVVLSGILFYFMFNKIKKLENKVSGIEYFVNNKIQKKENNSIDFNSPKISKRVINVKSNEEKFEVEEGELEKEFNKYKIESEEGSDNDFIENNINNGDLIETKEDFDHYEEVQEVDEDEHLEVMGGEEEVGEDGDLEEWASVNLEGVGSDENLEGVGSDENLEGEESDDNLEGEESDENLEGEESDENLEGGTKIEEEGNIHINKINSQYQNFTIADNKEISEKEFKKKKMI